jgi:hypothetical protein
MTTFLIGLAAFSSVFLGTFYDVAINFDRDVDRNQTINVTHGRHAGV